MRKRKCIFETKKEVKHFFLYEILPYVVCLIIPLFVLMIKNIDNKLIVSIIAIINAIFLGSLTYYAQLCMGKLPLECYTRTSLFAYKYMYKRQELEWERIYREREMQIKLEMKYKGRENMQTDTIIHQLDIIVESTRMLGPLETSQFFGLGRSGVEVETDIKGDYHLYIVDPRHGYEKRYECHGVYPTHELLSKAITELADIEMESAECED